MNRLDCLCISMHVDGETLRMRVLIEIEASGVVFGDRV